MFRGTFVSKVTAGAFAAALASITTADGGALTPSAPSGSLGSLAKALFGSIATKQIGVIDFGRGDITMLGHSVNNLTRIAAVPAVLSGVELIYCVPGADKTSPTWTFKNAGNTSIMDEVLLYAERMDDGDPLADPPVFPALIPDTRSDFQKALAAIASPTVFSASVASLIDRLSTLLDEQGKEAFMVVEDNTNTVRLYVVADTNPTVAFQSATGVASIDADSWFGVYSVPPLVASTSALL